MCKDHAITVHSDRRCSRTVKKWGRGLSIPAPNERLEVCGGSNILADLMVSKLNGEYIAKQGLVTFNHGCFMHIERDTKKRQAALD